MPEKRDENLLDGNNSQQENSTLGTRDFEEVISEYYKGHKDLMVRAKGILPHGKDVPIDSSKSLIELQDVHKQFSVAQGKVKVLRHINVSIMPGEFVLILGPSGSGKSTLLNTIMGLERPNSGKVLVGGNDFTEASYDRLARFRVANYGIVFQKPDWIKSLNVLENVAFPMAIANESRSKHDRLALELLDVVGIKSRASYKPYELSAGEQEKVEVARSLINNPPIIVADEPTGNLDSDSATKIMELFQLLNEKLKKTIIMVTHNVGQVKYATRTLYLKDGTILDGMNHDDEIQEYEETPVI